MRIINNVCYKPHTYNSWCFASWGYLQEYLVVNDYLNILNYIFFVFCFVLKSIITNVSSNVICIFIQCSGAFHLVACDYTSRGYVTKSGGMLAKLNVT